MAGGVILTRSGDTLYLGGVLHVFHVLFNTGL